MSILKAATVALAVGSTTPDSVAVFTYNFTAEGTGIRVTAYSPTGPIAETPKLRGVVGR